MRPAGIVHVAASRLISSHRAAEASAGRVAVNNCHSISNLVCRSMLAIDKSCISCGSCSGRMVGMCFLVGEGNALRTFAAVLMSISPLLAAKSITSLMRCKTRFSVSRLPRALMGVSISTKRRAVRVSIGVFPIYGNTYFSSERQMSLIVLWARFWFFFISYHNAATFSNVLPCRRASASSFCRSYSCGSVPAAINVLYSLRRFLASARETSSSDPKLMIVRFLFDGR